MNTVIISFKTVCHITSTVRGFSRSLSLSVWQLYVAYGKQHHIISRRLKRLPEEDCEIRLELYVIFIKRFNACIVNTVERKKSQLLFLEWGGHSPAIRKIYMKYDTEHGLFFERVNCASNNCQCFTFANSGINWLTIWSTWGA